MLKNIPGFAKLMRLYVFLLLDTTGYAMRKMEGPTKVNKINDMVRNQLVGWYASQVKDATILDKVTPKYPPGCHRMLPADLYFSQIQKPHVTFLDAGYPGEALSAVDETGVVTSDGKHIDADVIIWATGGLFVAIVIFRRSL